MAKLSTSLFLICLAFMYTRDVSADDNRQASSSFCSVYIVYMGTLPEIGYSASSHHLNMLQHFAASNLLIRSYKKSFNGFAANLSLAESHKLKSEYEGGCVCVSKQDS
ncbi:unnamed protein product [Arabis nemorensis]|uniref:Inhibitor I9 domain-containing protein n=1 Tax=Arabis nemorensis TaxID=586526 RepID=A0A565CS78_9BRAS|nr:unnamed protein product [Arabis nemorensis]